MTPLSAATYILAAEPAVIGTNVFVVLSQLGVAGVALFALGWYAKNQTARESARADSERAEVARLNSVILDKVVPVLGEAAQAVLKAQETQQATQQVIQDVYRMLNTLALDRRWGPPPVPPDIPSRS